MASSILPLTTPSKSSATQLGVPARPCYGLRSKLRGNLLNEKTDLSYSVTENNSGHLASRKPSRNVCAQVMMMPVSVIRVYHEDPKFGYKQWIDLWNYFYRNRIVFLTQYLKEDYVNQITATLIYLDYISNKKIWLYINSPGGDVLPSLTMYDAMHNTGSVIGTLCLGFAYNLSGLILAAGEKGLRKSMPRALIEVQPVGGEMHGQADDIYSEAMELRRIKDYVHEQLAEKTGHPKEKIEKDFARTQCFGALEAQDYGFIDDILRGQRIKASPPPKELESSKI